MKHETVRMVALDACSSNKMSTMVEQEFQHLVDPAPVYEPGEATGQLLDVCTCFLGYLSAVLHVW